jgi:hypothetical protein
MTGRKVKNASPSADRVGEKEKSRKNDSISIAVVKRLITDVESL